ncbi:hypothetical protein [uncultured Acidaminococcus sp.]|mgnify:FL=1|jgi:hypothetical protein|uniref:hypothetical protein n=1 Tax=Acidaminococcus sp. TaxID=1872103 RepID=UPI0025FF66E6|nr:hypothetical protein [uncultured Acidaminococcus sp.]
MKKRILSIFCLLLFALALPLTGWASGVSKDGYFGKIRLSGKVRIVEYNADIKVKVVNAFPDLKVKVVDYFPDEIGEWQFVEYGEDFTVQFVNSFPDITIQYVSAFPGVN